MKLKYACLAGGLLALATPAVAEPWVDYEPTKGFWTMTTIKVDSNKIDDYLTGLKEGWVPGQELARRNGLIDDYKIMVNTAAASGSWAIQSKSSSPIAACQAVPPVVTEVSRAPNERHMPAPPSIRTAAIAAPNPLSMFTTHTPGEQEFSIVSSGARPPNAAP